MTAKHRYAGFTLLEILVVVFIIGVTATFAIIAFSSRAVDDKLATEARRLEQLLRLASEEAVVHGIELGFLTDGGTYAFLAADEERGGWVFYPDEGPLRERELPKGFEIKLAVDDFDLPVAEKAKDEDEKEKQLTPQIYFLSSGELSPFELELTADGAKQRYRYSAKLTGEIELKTLDVERDARRSRSRSEK